MVLDVYVVANVKSVYDIDTISQTFAVEAKYKLTWRASGICAYPIFLNCSNNDIL